MEDAVSARMKVMAIPDLHCPFQHRDAYDFLAAVHKKQKPDAMVCLGDEADQHALSQHTHDPDGLSPGDELNAAVVAIQPLYALFPEMLVCTSNHGARPFRRAMESGIPRAYLRDYHEFMRAPKGWTWRDRWIIDGVSYQHGEGVSGAEGAMKLAVSNMMPTVIGHLHGDAGIRFWANSAALLWGMNAGWLGDQHAYAMAYGKHSLKKGILACAIVNRGMPFLLPMMLDKRGRWTGAL
jgi:hypothetical protein